MSIPDESCVFKLVISKTTELKLIFDYLKEINNETTFNFSKPTYNEDGTFTDHTVLTISQLSNDNSNMCKLMILLNTCKATVLNFTDEFKITLSCNSLSTFFKSMSNEVKVIMFYLLKADTTSLNILSYVSENQQTLNKIKILAPSKIDAYIKPQGLHNNYITIQTKRLKEILSSGFKYNPDELYLSYTYNEETGKSDLVFEFIITSEDLNAQSTLLTKVDLTNECNSDSINFVGKYYFKHFQILTKCLKCTNDVIIYIGDNNKPLLMDFMIENFGILKVCIAQKIDDDMFENDFFNQ